MKYLNQYNLKKYDLLNGQDRKSLLKEKHKVVETIAQTNASVGALKEKIRLVNDNIKTRENEVATAKKLLDMQFENVEQVFDKAELELVLQTNTAKEVLNKLDDESDIEVNKVFDTALPSLAVWNDERWGEWQSCASLSELKLPDFLRIGVTSKGVPVGIPFFHHDSLNSVILVKGTGEQRKQAQAILASLVLRIALSLPKISRFSLIDPDHHRCFKMRRDLQDVRLTDDLSGALNSISQDITRISNDILGYADSFEEVSSDIWASERFECIFVADFCSSKILKDSQTLKHLFNLSHGATSGRFLFMYVNTDIELPENVERELFKQATVIDLSEAEGVVFDIPPSGNEQNRLLNIIKNQKVAEKEVDFASLIGVSSATGWHDSSQDFIETVVGENISVWFGSKDGRNCPHGALAGTSGSGKSNFLHVLITGLALRYSPDELQFYLVDGKAGVGFKRYQKLPHAKVVSLQTSPLLALSVLREMEAEMDARYELFSKVGVDNLSSYRQQTSEIMPRVLLVADEYQNLFEANATEASNIMMKLAEKGRAAGVHLLLSSQSFVATGMSHGKKIFGNIAMRIALQLAEEPIEQFQPTGLKMIKELDRPGMVVINDNLGENSSNKRGMTAAISAKENTKLIDEMILLAEQSKLANDESPVVFEGSANHQLTDSHTLQHFVGLTAYLSLDELSVIAKADVRNKGFGIKGWHSSENPIAFMLGRCFEVYGDAILSLRRARQENALIVGHNVECAKRLLSTALISLTTIYDRTQLELYILDAGRVEMPGGALLEEVHTELLTPLSYKTHFSRGEDEIDTAIHALAAIVEERKSRMTEKTPSILVVLSDIEELIVENGTVDALNKLLSEGSKLGVHVILHVASIHMLSNLLNESRPPKCLRPFNHKVVWNMSEDDSRSVLGSKNASELNALANGEIAMYHNSANRFTRYFAPYQLPSSISPILEVLKKRG